MILEEFSNGYFIIRIYVEPSGDEDATLNAHTYEALRDELYDGEKDRGIIIKIRSRYYAVVPDRGTPTGVLELPSGDVEALHLYEEGLYQPALVPKPWFQSVLQGPAVG